MPLPLNSVPARDKPGGRSRQWPSVRALRRTADQGGDRGEVVAHRHRVALRLDVEAEQRFGVGAAQVEAPVAEVEGDAVGVVALSYNFV